jgi:hypothetical protein
LISSQLFAGKLNNVRPKCSRQFFRKATRFTPAALSPCGRQISSFYQFMDLDGILIGVHLEHVLIWRGTTCH